MKFVTPTEHGNFFLFFFINHNTLFILTPLKKQEKFEFEMKLTK